jgi:hypothetical protein
VKLRETPMQLAARKQEVTKKRKMMAIRVSRKFNVPSNEFQQLNKSSIQIIFISFQWGFGVLGLLLEQGLPLLIL